MSHRYATYTSKSRLRSGVTALYANSSNLEVKDLADSYMTFVHLLHPLQPFAMVT